MSALTHADAMFLNDITIKAVKKLEFRAWHARSTVYLAILAKFQVARLAVGLPMEIDRFCTEVDLDQAIHDLHTIQDHGA